jgi:hypothetical protein
MAWSSFRRLKGFLIDIEEHGIKMNLQALKQRGDILEQIDWDLTPQEAVEMFDHRARGLERRLQVRDPRHKSYFFCVDNWGARPRLVLKERSVKEARVIAEIQAPDDLLDDCVDQYGNRKGLYPLTQELKRWLRGQLYR